MNRRTFLTTASAAAIAAAGSRQAWAQSPAGSIALSPAGTPVPLPANFTGLSYESAQLANPNFFSAKNKDLVSMVKTLGRGGILRIGGNTSDFDDWKPEHPAAIANGAMPVGPDAGLNIGRHTAVTETAIDQLRTFLDATGWTLLYGINLGHGDPARAANEAAYVVRTIGPALTGLQIGNEADLFYKNGMRKPDYTYKDFFTEWQTFADAIRHQTPNAPIAGPDIGNHIDWVDQFAQQAKGIKLLTSHYYAEGPPSSPAADIPHLLRSHPTLVEHMEHLVALGKSVGLPYRMCEGNSCYHGGKPGVSDAFASALWGADFMMLLAQTGVAGVNFHGGGEGYYTPIAGGGTEPFVARPLFYGMLLFREFAGSNMLPVDLESGGVLATAYASEGVGGRLKLAVINKDSRSLQLALRGDRFAQPVRQLSLSGPSLASLTGTTLGGGGVSGEGHWSGHDSASTPAVSDASLTVPAASALLVEFAGRRG